jgi:DNA-binding YbaB/EbfC family protein
MFNKLKQFKDIRDKAKQLQDMLGAESAEGASGWGKVKITVNGLQQVVDVAIDPSLANDIPKLQDLVKEAANDAMQNIQKKMALKMKDMGGLDLAKDLQDMVQQNGGEGLSA